MSLTSVIRYVRAQDTSSTTGVGKTGLAFGDFTAKYLTQAGTLTSLTTETITTLGTYQAPTSAAHIRIKEVSSSDPCKGIYEVHFHNTQMVDTGQKLWLFLSASGAAIPPVEVELLPFKADLLQILGTTLTETSPGYLAAAFKKLFDVAVPVLTAASVNNSGDPFAVVSSGTYGNSALKTLLDAVDDYIDTEVAAIKAKTDNLPASPAAVGSAMTLTSGERTAIGSSLFAQTLPAGNPGEFGNTVTSAAVYAVEAATDTAALVTRLSALRGSYLDNLSAGAVATSAALAAAKLILDNLETAIELDGSVYRFTTNALEQSPAGGGGGGDATLANQVLLLKLMRADIVVDKTTNPTAWDFVWYEAGTATELMRKPVKDVDGAAIASTGTVVGGIQE